LRHPAWQAVREELAAVLAADETAGARVQALRAVLLEE
jgi:hypothetical protein